MARYLVERTFTVAIEEMPPIGRKSNELIHGEFPEITWEHSHVVVTDDGTVRTYCITTRRTRMQSDATRLRSGIT